MTSKEIITEIIEKYNSDPTTKGTLYFKNASLSGKFHQLEFGADQDHCLIVKERGDDDVMTELLCYNRLLLWTLETMRDRFMDFSFLIFPKGETKN